MFGFCLMFPFTGFLCHQKVWNTQKNLLAEIKLAAEFKCEVV